MIKQFHCVARNLTKPDLGLDLTALIRGDDCLMLASGCEPRYASLGVGEARSPHSWGSDTYFN